MSHIDTQGFRCHTEIFAVELGKNFRTHHGKLLGKIEHVIGAAVAQKAFLVVAVEGLNFGGIGGAVKQIFQNGQARDLEGGKVFVQANFREGKAAIDLPVDDKTLGFGESVQKKFVVREIVNKLLRHEVKFQICADKLFKGGRRSIFLPRTP